jgi:hypothetical protein
MSLQTLVGEVVMATNPSCIDEYMTAVRECSPRAQEEGQAAKRVVAAEACAKAKAALADCFGRKSIYLELLNIGRAKPEPEHVEEVDTGTRRS